MYDPQLYRSKTEVKEWEGRGPLITLTRRLKESALMTEEDFLRLQAQATAEVDDAVQFAEAGTLEPLEDLERFIYAEDAT
jgi:TPP-dependent pyruvate/acetoin dehydrogenase alpha subunit